MANFLRCLAFILFSTSLYAAEPGEIDLAGWVKNAEGTFSKAFSDSNGTSKITLNSPPTGLSMTSTALVNTSKGVQPFEITKTADIDVSRVGKAMRGLAVLGGPVGMAVTAASLVCELTEICNQAGQWMLGADPALEGFPTTTPNYKWNGYNQETFPSPFTACNSPGYLAYRGAASASPVMINEGYYDCGFKSAQGDPIAGWTPRLSGCANNYVLISGQCVLQGNSVPRVPTTADWNSKESLLNDARFVPELNEKGNALPTSGIPTLSPDQKKRLGVDSEPTRDSQGNVTGRQETITEIEAVDAGTSEKPGKVIIKETVTKIQYDNNNTQVSSSTSTSYSSQPQTENKPQTFEIKFDEVPPATLPTHSVSATFSHTTWGDGSCPPDINVPLPYTGASFSIPSEPVCSTAEMINPFVVLLASIAGIFIVTGVSGSNKS